MTEDQTYMLRAIFSLEDARAYLSRVGQLRRDVGDVSLSAMLQGLQRDVVDIHDSAAWIYEELQR